MLKRLRSSARWFVSKSTKEEAIGAKRKDLYSMDVFKVTDDGIKWSYESNQSKGSVANSNRKPKQSINVNQEAMSKLPVAVKGDFNRADILKQINACVDAQPSSV